MSEWQETILEDIASFKTGKLNSNAAVQKGKYPFFTCSPETYLIDEYAFDCSAILLAGNNANAVYPIKKYNGKFNAYQRTYVISIKNDKNFNLDFLYYYLTFKINYLKDISQGSATKFLTAVILNNLQVSNPPLEEQKAIAAVLSCLDGKIENLRKQNETLEAIAQTLFKHWFIDFEFPNDEGKPYKSSGGAMMPSERGEIPTGWQVGTLKNIVEVFTGFPFKSNLYSFDDGIRVVRGENVSLGFLRWDTEKKWNLGIEEYQEYLLQENDYVIGMDGSRVGKNRTIIFKSDLPLILAQRVARLRAKKDHFQSYTNILLMKNQFQKYVDFVKTGTSIPHISSTQIKDFECLIPDSKTLSLFDKIYKPWSSKVNNIKEQIQTLTKTRDTLLPKLMSGKLRVQD
ncbi:MAG: restriction endonuclease subunit S [Limnothrix sp.]